MKIKEILFFLTQLKQNNNREWFNANKNIYLQAKSQFDDLMLHLIKEVSLFDPEIGYLEPKDCTFRIYRDVRFSKDKSPYKTNFGGFIVKGGRKSGNAGYYLHLDPNESFIGGGSHMPDSESLKNIRLDICHYTQEFVDIIENKYFKSTFGKISGDQLVKVPKGFPDDFSHPDLIKYKSYTVFTPLDEKQLNLSDQDFINLTVDTFKKMQPFIQFLNRAIDTK
jgi:uncharacterized protein (TIGR02453 family)